MFQGQKASSLVLPEDLKKKIDEINVQYETKFRELDQIRQAIQKESIVLDNVKISILSVQKELVNKENLTKEIFDKIFSSQAEIAKNKDTLSKIQVQTEQSKNELEKTENLLQESRNVLGVYQNQTKNVKKEFAVLVQNLNSKEIELEKNIELLEKNKKDLEISIVESKKLINSIDSLEEKKEKLEIAVKELNSSFLDKKEEINSQLVEFEKELTIVRDTFMIEKLELTTISEQLKKSKEELVETQTRCKQELQDLEDQKNAFAVHVRETRTKYPNIKI